MTTQQPDRNAVNQVSEDQWNELNFEGKEFCALNGSELILKASEYGPERKLSELNTENYIPVTSALSEKFKEIREKLQVLDEEWQQSEDKLKLTGKIARFKDYIGHANAIGDYSAIYKDLVEKENQLRQLLEVVHNEKLKLAELAESLKDSEEWKETTERFRSIIEQWKNAQTGDKGKFDKLWDRIDRARNHFYDRKRQHHEQVEQELMQNLDLKMEICETAEQLALSGEWKKTADIFKELMTRWKKIGKAASTEKNEEMWQRFNNARNTFFERKKQNFEQIQAEQEANYQMKVALVEKAEALSNSTDWKETTDKMAGLMEEWKKIGKVPIEKSEELWKNLHAARDKFFAAKRQKTEEVRLVQEDNYNRKLALLNRAEQIKSSTGWKETTDEMNELLSEWKTIGHVPRKYGDELWEKFIAARQHFFNRKDEDREKRKSRFLNRVDNRYQQTRQFLEKIKEELEEEEEKLEDFKESLKNTTGNSAKEQELRKHLENLIAQTEKKIPERKKKVEEVTKQYEELKNWKEEIKEEQEK